MLSKKSKNYIRSFVINVGLLLLLIVYNIIGSYVFMKLEKGNEDKRIRYLLTSHEYLNESLEKLKVRLHNWKLLKIERKESIKDLLEEHQRNVKYVIKNMAYPGHLRDQQNKWSIQSSLLFCISALTLVGFGHVAPKSHWGQLVLIPWCIFGVVLTSLYLAVVANLIMTSWQVMYRKIFCYACSTKRTNRHSIVSGQRDTGMIKKGKMPFTFTIIFLCVYLALGSALYKYTEKWSWAGSSYFVFTTLSTIGFGDLVPGWTDASSFAGKMSLLISSVYIVFGMATVTAVFATIIEKLKYSAEVLEENFEDLLEEVVGDEDELDNEDRVGTKFGRNVRL